MSIQALATEWRLTHLLTKHTIEARTTWERFQVFYHPDGRLWCHGFVTSYGSLGGPAEPDFARNTLARLHSESNP